MHDANHHRLPTQGAESTDNAIRVLLLVRQRLHREGYAALLAGDGRFRRLATPPPDKNDLPPHEPHTNDAPPNDPLPSNDSTPVVALVDATCEEQTVRDALSASKVAGGVLVAEEHAGQLEGPVRIAGATLRVVGSDASWAEVAQQLVAIVRAPADQEDIETEPPPTLVHCGTPRNGHTLADEIERYVMLTPREQQVLGALGLGKSPPQIAAEFHIALSTVENHKSRLMKKLNVHRMAELVRFAVRVGAAPL